MAVALVLFAIKFWSVHLRCLVVPASLDSHTSYEANEEASKEICFKQIMHPISIRYAAGKLTKDDLKPTKKAMLKDLGLKATKATKATKRPAAAAKAASKRPAAADAVPKKEQKEEKGEEEEEEPKKKDEEEEEEDKDEEDEEEQETNTTACANGVYIYIYI